MAWTFMAQAITPYIIKTLNPDGTPQTNAILIQPYPANQPFYIYGTNIIFGPYTITNVPDATGYFSNNIFAGVYSVRYANVPSSGYFVQIPDSPTVVLFAACATNLPINSSGLAAGFGFVTNLLGYLPATNNVLGGTSGNFNVGGLLSSTNEFVVTNQAPYSYKPSLTNGPLNFAYNAGVTNTNNARIEVSVTWQGTITTPSTVTAWVTDTNYTGGVIPPYSSTVPGAGSGSVSNTLTFPMSPFASVRFTNTVGTATLVTNVVVFK